METLRRFSIRWRSYLALACIVTITVTFFFGWQSDVDINSDVSLRSISPITRSIMLMPGWQNYINPADLPNEITCPQTNNTCILQHTESLSPDSSDIAVFHESGLSQSPPCKRKGQLWVFRTGESQQSLTADHMEFWDGYFNYSIDHREGATMQTYVTTPRKVDTPTKRDFAKEKLALLKQTKMHSDALWLVSNCNTDGVYKVGSGRAEYASELSQWINITAYTGNSLGGICSTNKFIKPLLKERTNGEEKPMSQFLFYLSFENILCSNYITEKLWKVLLSSDLTIPVVMGGRAMRDYKSIAPPNSYIDVRNFTSPKRLADHLNYVATDAAAFNYYHQWRNELTFTPPPSTVNAAPPPPLKPGVATFCAYCNWAWNRPASVFKKMGEHFHKNQCLDVSKPSEHCKYYNMQCANN